MEKLTMKPSREKGIAMLALDEENSLIRQAQSGDKAAMERLIAQYKGLVLKAAAKSRNLGFYDDAIATGYTALILAVRQFDEKRGVNFASWARAKVYGDIATLFKREKRTWDRETSGDCLHLSRGGRPDGA